MKLLGCQLPACACDVGHLAPKPSVFPWFLCFPFLGTCYPPLLLQNLTLPFIFFLDTLTLIKTPAIYGCRRLYYLTKYHKGDSGDKDDGLTPPGVCNPVCIPEWGGAVSSRMFSTAS